MSFEKICEVSEKVGKRVPYWTQGAGGNISYKDNSSLWVKRSGARLIDVQTKNELSHLNKDQLLEKIRQIQSEEDYAKELKASSYSGNPSMESGFHVVLPHKWVLHFHSLASLLMFHLYEQNPSHTTQWFHQRNWHPAWMPYIQPGLQVAQWIDQKEKSNVYLMKNHGLILSFDDLENLKAWEDLELEFIKHFFPRAEELFHIKNRKDAVALMPTEVSGALKCYFPDVAVFLKEMRMLFAKTEDRYHIRRDEIEKIFLEGSLAHQNLTEILMAIFFLQKHCPDLVEIPQEQLTILPALPTEKIRKEAQ